VKHKGVIAIGFAVVSFAAASMIFGDSGYLELQRARQQQRNLEQYAFELQQNNEEMRHRVTLLQSDMRFLERLARERLGLVRPDEIVYVVDGEGLDFREP